MLHTYAYTVSSYPQMPFFFFFFGNKVKLSALLTQEATVMKETLAFVIFLPSSEALTILPLDYF